MMEKSYFALFAHGRTGTTYFRSLLNTHPLIHCYGEVLFPDFRPTGFYHFWHQAILQDRNNLLHHRSLPGLFEQYLKDTAHNTDARIVGFDLKIPQIQETPILHATVWELRIKALHLVRDNALRTVVSRTVMYERMARGASTVHLPYTPEPIAVRINPSSIISDIQSLQETDDIIRQKYEGSKRCPYLRIRYEDLAGPQGPDIVLNQVCDFLDVGPFETPPESELKRQNPSPVRDLIANITEVERALKGTPYESMLDD